VNRNGLVTTSATIETIGHTVLSGFSAIMRACTVGVQAMPNKTGPATSSELVVVGLLAIAMGAMVTLNVSGVLPGKGARAPIWVGVCGGLTFMLAGGALLLRWLAGGETHDGEMPRGTPFWLRAVYYLIGLICIGALAAVGTWVAFGPGTRAFSMSLPFLGKGPANEWLGRAVFGTGTLIVWLFFIVAARTYWRKLMHASDPEVQPQK